LDVQVSVEPVGTREVELTVTPDEGRIRQDMRQAARRISKARPVAGFRPGKAPYELVERMFGRETILNEALSEEASAFYREAIQEAGIQPYEQTLFDLESEDPVVLKVRVPLVPEAKLEDYAALKIEPEPEVSIADEEIDDQLKSLQRQHAEYEQVERSIEMGDQVVAAVIGKADGQEVINMESATLNVTDEMMPPGFAEAIMGANTGDTLEFTLSYPEDFDNEELAGKTVDFMVDISIVRQTTLPPLDDELATKVGESDGIETLTQLRERIAQALFEQKEAAARSRETRAAIDALVSVATVEFPQAALDNEIEQAIQSQRSRLTRMGYEFERYLQMIGQTEEELREQLRPDAERNLTERLVLAEYARAEGIDLEPNEMQAAFRDFAANLYGVYGARAEEAMRNAASSGVLASVYGDARVRKAGRLLADRLAGREIKPVTPIGEPNPDLQEFLDASQEAPSQE
jgi:trigger factor